MGRTRVPAIFDGEHVRLLRDAPVSEPYRVVVEFVEPANAISADAPTPHNGVSPDESPFWESFGSWQDDRSTEDILSDIRSARRSRSQPPAV